MAGYCRDDVEVKSDNNQLGITTKENVGLTGKFVLFSSIKRKPIDITLAIDKVYDTAKAKVEFLDGMLKINIPRAEGSECKKLF
jgi:HSP20 family molecular chaperone IbpA